MRHPSTFIGCIFVEIGMLWLFACPLFNLLRNSVVLSPSSVIRGPRYGNVSTCSSCWFWMRMRHAMPWLAIILTLYVVRRFSVLTSVVTESPRKQHHARYHAVSSVEVNDAEMTNIKISSLLPQQSYRIGVAAKTSVGVGIAIKITVNTGSFNVRT